MPDYELLPGMECSQSASWCPTDAGKVVLSCLQATHLEDINGEDALGQGVDVEGAGLVGGQEASLLGAASALLRHCLHKYPGDLQQDSQGSWSFSSDASIVWSEAKAMQ